jgi:hypothetical protein
MSNRNQRKTRTRDETSISTCTELNSRSAIRALDLDGNETNYAANKLELIAINNIKARRTSLPPNDVHNNCEASFMRAFGSN